MLKSCTSSGNLKKYYNVSGSVNIRVHNYPQSNYPIETAHRRDRQEYPVAVERESNQAQTVPTENDVDNQDNQQIVSIVRDVYPQINETLEAVVLDGSMKILLKVPVSDLLKRLDSTEGAKVLVLDGIVTQD